jgi:hypothetical protein
MAAGGAAAVEVKNLLAACQEKLSPGDYAVVEEEQAVLVAKKLVSPAIVASKTCTELEGYGISPGAAAALKIVFPTGVVVD